MKNLITFFVLLSFFNCQSQLINISGIVNSYYKTDSIYTSNCRSYIELSNSIGLAKNDKILIIQMQGAVIDTTNTTNFGSIKRYMNAGNFEFATIKDIQSNKIELNSMLLKYFNSNDIVQVVKVARYKSAKVIGTINCIPFNGNTGGVIAIEVLDTLELNANIDVSNCGFRGGNLYPNELFNCSDTRPFWSLFTASRGPKGEGIYKYNSRFEAGINNTANAGGGGSANNSGGGGGANAGIGGYGGDQSTDCGIGGNNGLGGQTIDYILQPKVFMGGGGGAGQQDENMATPGMNGAGIIFIKANYLIGNSNSILADGGSQTNDAGNGIIADGAGAGGAGGTVILDVSNYSTSTTISTKGGNGGNTKIENAIICTGPGGGGGGGLIWHKGVALPPTIITNTNAGNAGITINSLSINNGTSFGAGDGDIGMIKTNYTPVINFYRHPDITSFNNDTIVCAKDSILLQINFIADGPITTDWSPNVDIAYATNKECMIAPSINNTYYVTIIDSIGCSDIDTFNVTVLPLPSSNLLHEYIIQLYDSIQLHSNIYDSIYWAPNRFIDSINSFNPTLTPPRTQLYRYYLIDSNQCIFYDSLLIKVKQCTDLGLANIFTPNGDGINDVYHFKNILIDQLLSFQIFTRWGELIFETNNLNDSWNGTFNGKEMDTDVYTYQISGICYGAIFKESGNISLLR